MAHTIVYTVGNREFSHTSSGNALTRFLRDLERNRVPYRFADKPKGSNVFAGIIVKGK